MTAEGHDEQQAGKDPFALSGEEFEAEKNRLLNPTADDDKEATEGEAAMESSDDTPGDTAEKVEVEPFALEEPKETKPETVETFEIVHRGQVHKVTKEKLVELAQKGFDYDVKVGPHGKLVQLIDSDRGAADVLNDYIRSKYSAPIEKKPSLKPMSEYDDERQWLEDNVKTIVAQQPKPQPVNQDPVSVMKAAIQAYDPTGSFDVIPALADHAVRLSVRDSRTIEEAAARGDMRPFFKFYDHVKAQLKPSLPPPKQSFKMKSGGGEPPRTTDKQINAWDLPAKDFQAMLAKVKSGYS